MIHNPHAASLTAIAAITAAGAAAIHLRPEHGPIVGALPIGTAVAAVVAAKVLSRRRRPSPTSAAADKQARRLFLRQITALTAPGADPGAIRSAPDDTRPAGAVVDRVWRLAETSGRLDRDALRIMRGYDLDVLPPEARDLAVAVLVRDLISPADLDAIWRPWQNTGVRLVGGPPARQVSVESWADDTLTGLRTVRPGTARPVGQLASDVARAARAGTTQITVRTRDAASRRAIAQ